MCSGHGFEWLQCERRSNPGGRPRSLSVLAESCPTLSNNHDLGNGDKVRYLSQISEFFVSI